MSTCAKRNALITRKMDQQTVKSRQSRLFLNRVFRFSGIFSNSAISLRIRARGKKYPSDIVLEYIIFACEFENSVFSSY